MRNLIIYIARRIITMEPGWPEGTVVAVDGNRIVAVGRDLKDLEPWMSAHKYEIDDRFRDKVLIPGLVEAHLHALLAATHFPSVFVTPDPWDFPTGQLGGTASLDEVLSLIKDRHAAMETQDEWLFAFGYAKAAHGQLTRTHLDGISPNRPIAVTSRSSHVIILNSAAIDLLGIEQEEVTRRGLDEFVRLEEGYFSEDGQFVIVMPRIRPFLMHPDRVTSGLILLRDMLHANGVTTMHEPGSGIWSGGRPEHELDLMAPVLDQPNVPFRTLLTPGGSPFVARLGSAEAACEHLDDIHSLDGDRIKFTRKKVKFFADGSYVDQIGQWDQPGYIDGHEGQWMIPPENLRQWCRVFWLAGYDIHIHTMGDLGARLAVDILDELQREKPRFDHGFTFEHFNGASPETIRRAARLGASVSSLIWPLRSVGEEFANAVLGIDRLHQTFPMRTVSENGMTLAIHADTIVSPPQPLLLAWLATTRESLSGQVLGENERISVEHALRCVTIDAARILRASDDIGSIRAGKLADFAVLDADPFEDGVQLKDIGIWGTVFEGQPSPAPK